MFAQTLAKSLAELELSVVSGGTENHIVLVDLAPQGLTGLVAELALEECGVVVNKNRVPGDTTPALVTSGIRLGTNGAARRGMGPAQAVICAEVIEFVLRSVTSRGIRDYSLPWAARDVVRERVGALCDAFPLPGYPALSTAWVSAEEAA
jgi:glycine hydroxymethyltransferase